MLSYRRAVGVHRDGDHVVGARLRDLRDGTEQDVDAPVTVIAAGPWSAEVAAMGGITYQMQLSRGAMIGFNGRWTSRIINRLHWPGDGDIFIPLGAHGVAGTTSVPTSDPGDRRMGPWERERIMDEICEVLPALRHAMVLREWAGVRPLFDPALKISVEASAHVDGRKAARTFEVLDHAQRDGVAGLFSVVGGKLTTYRLMGGRVGSTVWAGRAPRHGVGCSRTRTASVSRSSPISLRGSGPRSSSSSRSSTRVPSG